MTDAPPKPTPWWQIISRTFGIVIVLSVTAGWLRGQSISDPGVLLLLGIGAGLLGVDVAAFLRRNGRHNGKTGGDGS